MGPQQKTNHFLHFNDKFVLPTSIRPISNLMLKIGFEIDSKKLGAAKAHSN